MREGLRAGTKRKREDGADNDWLGVLRFSEKSGACGGKGESADATPILAILGEKIRKAGGEKKPDETRNRAKGGKKARPCVLMVLKTRLRRWRKKGPVQ